MQAIAMEGFDVWSCMETYLQLWSFPGTWKAGHLATLFASKHVAKYKSTQKFPSQANLLDMVHLEPHTTRAKLLEVAETAMETFQAADFGIPLMIKWHWLLHRPDFLPRHGNLPFTFSASATRLQKTTVAMELTTLSRDLPVGEAKKSHQAAVGPNLHHFVDGPATEAL
ncbi:HMGS, partial [Symbiodinium necroappetens]